MERASDGSEIDSGKSGRKERCQKESERARSSTCYCGERLLPPEKKEFVAFSNKSGMIGCDVPIRIVNPLQGSLKERAIFQH